MRLTRLTASRVRNLQPVDISPGPSLNLIIGSNGAGKTSLLEAMHLLAYGRSFRGRVRDGLIQSGEADVEVFVEWVGAEGRSNRAGLRHAGQDWQGRLNGEAVPHLNQLCAALAVLTFEPGSHSLVSGSSEIRRRFLDWGLFHVEPGFLQIWRRYARALKQRNALLKQRVAATELDVWDAELVAAAEPLDAGREAYLERLQLRFPDLSAALVPSLGTGWLGYSPGWRRRDLSLADALLLARDRDRVNGFTSVGPHRADWQMHHAHRPDNELLSRGQGKLTALACLLAQAEDFADRQGHWPVMLLDDLAAELDRDHQARLVARLVDSGAQVFLTGTESPAVMDGYHDARVFKVERGAVFALVPDVPRGT